MTEKEFIKSAGFAPPLVRTREAGEIDLGLRIEWSVSSNIARFKKYHHLWKWVLAVLFPGIAAVSTAQPATIPVSITVDATKPLGELKPIWRMFGADEPNYASMRDGKKLMHELGALKPDSVFFRTHNLLCSGDGRPAFKWGSTGAYSEDSGGHPIYDWKILDGIFDVYHDSSVRPYVQIGFMPEALSTHPEPYQHHWKPGDNYSDIETGWAYPPKDYDRWRELVHQWTAHCVGRYGNSEVEKWYWEVWNEANGAYWKSTPQEFFKLHDYAVDGVRRSLPSARVGGPDTAGSGGKWMREFIEHCLHGTNSATGKIGTPLDFVSFHAKGAPEFTNNHVRMGIVNQLRAVDEGFRIIKSYPELSGIPIVIGECDPDGCAACQGRQLGYRNTTMYSSYTAASFARIWELARLDDVNLDAALTWAFEFEDQPPFAGFRQLATAGIDLPVLNVFRMFSQLRGQQVEAFSDCQVPLQTMLHTGVRDKPDIAALAALDTNHLAVMIWHYHDDDQPGPDAEIALHIGGIPASTATLKRYAIDSEHGNAFATWQRMGSPQTFSTSQSVELNKAAELAEIGSAQKAQIKHGLWETRLMIPRQAVELIVLEFSGSRK